MPERTDLEESDALLALIAAEGPSAPRRALLQAHGSAAAARAAGGPEWARHGLRPGQADAWLHPDPGMLARGRAWLRQPRHCLLGWHDPDYPALLRRAPSPPLALFVAGDPAMLWHPAIALVGSRSPSAGGIDNASGFANAFAAWGLAVTSGMAAGIDTAAHGGALSANGKTIAVLGTGPDVPYPRANTGLHARIAGQGAVVSEQLPGTGVRRELFPRRNRIIAGLSLGTLVIEAARRSGALITARLAADAGREVFALPGSIHNPLARGCHRLIRDGATLVESAQEVLEAIGPLAERLAEDLRGRLGTAGTGDATAPGSGMGAPGPGNPDYQRLWEALGHDPTGMDGLVSRTGLTAAQLSSMLLAMELEGRVVSRHGRYNRTH